MLEKGAEKGRWVMHGAGDAEEPTIVGVKVEGACEEGGRYSRYLLTR